jgi:hypothetical protein
LRRNEIKMNKKRSLNIDRIAFLGRTYSEYLKMLDLGEDFLHGINVLDCPAGASSFTAESLRKGLSVTACDVLYDLLMKDLVRKGQKDIRHVFERFDEVSHLYTWKYYRNRKEVIDLRRKALSLFSEDYIGGIKRGNYVQACLPDLPFPDGRFDLVLSSHFLFLYGDRLDIDFHMSCLRELLRVSSGEVRIFPLTGLDAQPYPHLYEILCCLRSEGINASVMKVPFEFQRGANMMMKLKKK